MEWLFLNSTSTTVKCPGDCPWKRKADALLHLKSIASRIRAADADIVVLAEVQDCDVGRVLLREVDDPTLRFYLIPGKYGYFALLQLYHSIDSVPAQYFLGSDTATGQNVALLTRIDPSGPLSRSEARVQYPVRGSSCGYRSRQNRKAQAGGKAESSGVSKHFVARFVLPNPLCYQALSSSCSVSAIEISLIAAHLVSKPTDPRACAQREAQATGGLNTIASGCLL